jgi:electron transfer flavoprotein beta subunit
MKAKKKPLKKFSAADLGVDLSSKLQTIEVTEPPKRVGGKKVESVEEVCLPFDIVYFFGGEG